MKPFKNILNILLAVTLLASCQRNLTKTELPDGGIIQQTQPIEVKQFLTVDSAALYTSVADLPGDDTLRSKIIRYYSDNHSTRWLEEDKPNTVFAAFMEQIETCGSHGLFAAEYNPAGLRLQVHALYGNKPADIRTLIALDIKITATFFKFARHLRFGRLTSVPEEKNAWLRSPQKDDNADIELLGMISDPGSMADAILFLQPVDDQYKKLQSALSYYRSLESSEAGMTTIPFHEKMLPGNRYAAIPAVRRKLLLNAPFLESDSIIRASDSLLFDANLAGAIKEFQRLHGLYSDGVIGESTLRWLNQSFREKAELIALNMERIRWQGPRADHYIRVNIPEFRLWIHEGVQTTLEMDVIVGAPNTKTPVFEDTLESVVLSPTWTVPPSIMKSEVFPRLKKNPSYYTARKNYVFYRKGVEIDPATLNWETDLNIHEFRVVQKAGFDNALGLAKFMMPNHLNIYLHDTPDHSLFSKTFRAFSHGCIRLSDPAALAEYLLKDQVKWDRKAIDKAMNSHSPTRVTLKKQYPVYLEYKTVWVDERGQVNFRNDLYGHDKRQLRQMTIIPTAAPMLATR